MKLNQLSYSVQKKYTIPYLPHVFYAVTFLLLGILVVVNVALAGSDVVTTLRRDPNSVERPWWTPKFWPDSLVLRIPDICQPQSINDDPTLRTNSTVPIFKYALRSATSPGASDDPSQRMYPVPYMANPLSDCKVESIIWRVDIPIRIMSYKATISCALEGKKEFGNFRVPDNIKLSLEHYRTRNTDLGPDEMKDHLAFNVAPGLRDPNGNTHTEFALQPLKELGTLPANSTSPNNVLAVLDGMQADLFHAIWAQRNIWVLTDQTHYDTYVVEWAAGEGNHCWSNGVQNGTCGHASAFHRIIRWYGTTKDWGSTRYTAEFLRPFNATIINMFVAIRDAIMIDLGNTNTTSNIYLNKSYYNEAITVDAFHSAVTPIMLNASDSFNLTSEDYWRFCSFWNCVNGSWAQAIRDTSENASVQNITLPYKPISPQAPSVFGFSYLCPTFQRKPINSLLLSVFVATATTFSVIYALFDLFMPKAEERYQRRTQAMRNAINLNPEDKQEGYPLVRQTHTRDSSHTLYSSLEGEADKDTHYDYMFPPTKSAYEPDNTGSYGYRATEYHPNQRL